METRRNRTKRAKFEDEFANESDVSNSNDPIDDSDELRKSRIRDSNHEFAKRMTILQTWSAFWSDFSTREGEAYPAKEARSILKKTKKIACPIASCGKVFTTMGGLRYHYARCNIERCFKCKLCIPHSQVKTRGDLLRHMVRAHYDQLPELDEERKEIAHAYLSSGRVEKVKTTKKPYCDAEIQLNCATLIKLYNDLNDEALKPSSYSNRPFKEWRSLVRDWQLLAYDIDKRRYYPPETESARFRCSQDECWSVLSAGDSSIPNMDKEGLPLSVLFYTGGINTSSAWLTKPLHDSQANAEPDLIAISVSCSTMDRSLRYKDGKDLTGCIQFWTTNLRIKTDMVSKNAAGDAKPKLTFAIGHNYGYIYEMVWCPLGTSWEPQVHGEDMKVPDLALSRVGLLALACGDGQVRIISVPHVKTLLSNTMIRHSHNIIESTPTYRVKPIATLMPPGVGLSTDYRLAACTAVCWGLEDNQRLLVAGYSNGFVAVFDLASNSPVLVSSTEHRHIYQPLKTWSAHSLTVSGVAFTSRSLDRTYIATGSRDRYLKLWSLTDLNSCISCEKSYINKIAWDYRYRGVMTATEDAFSSFNNRVHYRYPTTDNANNSNVTVSAHRATVWGLANSVITSSVATSDDSGEVFIVPQLICKSLHRRDRNTQSLYSMIPRELDQMEDMVTNHNSSLNQHQQAVTTNEEVSNDKKNTDNSLSNDVVVVDVNNQDGLYNYFNIISENNENSFAEPERRLANKPSKYLLPYSCRSIETYSDFKNNFGLEFIEYHPTVVAKDQKQPESSIRAFDISELYCDRPNDYPFSRIRHVSWSPNIRSFPCLLSVSHIGLCRLDRVQMVEQIYKGYLSNLLSSSYRERSKDGPQ